MVAFVIHAKLVCVFAVNDNRSWSDGNEIPHTHHGETDIYKIIRILWFFGYGSAVGCVVIFAYVGRIDFYPFVFFSAYRSSG